jgi:ORF6N domain
MFQMTAEEFTALKSQFAISNPGRGGRRTNPYVFTEEGVAMLSSVLHSERAVQVNISIMRAFIRLRELAASHKDVHRRLDEMEQKYDRQFKVVFDAIRALMEPPKTPRRRVGY